MNKAANIKKSLITLCLFIGIGAFGGALMMLISSYGSFAGMSALLDGMQKLPFSEILFQNLVVPGIALFVIIGVPQIITAALLIRKNKYRYSGLISLFCGIALMLWIILQFAIYPFNPMSIIYFILGLIQVNLSIALIKITEKNTDDKSY